MKLHELKPQDDPRYAPSLHIVREVIDAPEKLKEIKANLEREVRRRPLIDRHNVDITLDKGSAVTLIGSDEILNLYKAVGKDATHDSLGDLDDYLTTQLPDSMLNTRALMAVRPLDSRFDSYPADPTRGLPWRVYADFVSTADERLGNERARAQEALYDFFGISPGSLNPEDVWADPLHSNIGKLLVAHVVGHDNIQETGFLLERTTALPLSVTLAPTSVLEF